MNQFWRLISTTVLLVAFMGCADPTEYATFYASGFEDLPDCLVERFPLELDFQAARQRADTVGIYLQSASDIRARSDVIYFEVYTPHAIAGENPLTLQADPLQGPLPAARGKVLFSSSCPFHRDSLEIRGALSFDSFDLNHGGLVAGRLDDGSIINPRTGEPIVAQFSGSWRFIVRKGPPYEDFYALPERPEPGDF